MSLSDSGIDTLKRKVKKSGGDHYYEFGCIFFKGNHAFAPSYEQAIDCFKQSSNEFNNLISQFNVGIMYRDGLGVDKDEHEAYLWFRKSAENGYEKAQVIVGCYLLEGKFVRRDYRAALNWFKAAMNNGNAEAFYYASIIYKKGLGVTANFKIAIDLLKTSANLGLDKAQYEMGNYLYSKGSDSPDYYNFHQYLTLAAQQNNLPAQYFLSKVYLNQQNALYSPKKGYELLINSIKHGNVEALVDLSELYRKGQFIEKDKKKAKALLNQALQLGSSRARELLSEEVA